MDKDAVLKLIYKSIDELNESVDEKFVISSGVDTELFGDNSGLDSLSLVSLVASVEAAVEDETNEIISLADERALSQKDNPFKTIDSLAKYVTLLVSEK